MGSENENEKIENGKMKMERSKKRGGGNWLKI